MEWQRGGRKKRDLFINISGNVLKMKNATGEAGSKPPLEKRGAYWDGISTLPRGGAGGGCLQSVVRSSEKILIIHFPPVSDSRVSIAGCREADLGCSTLSV